VRLTAAEKRAQVVRMRRSRMSFPEIAQALGVTKQRAHAIYTKALQEIPRTEVEEHRAEQLELIDTAIHDLLKLAYDHSRPRSAIESWNTIARYIELEARLVDAFPPAKSRVSVITEEMVQAEIERLSAEIAEERLPVPRRPGVLALPSGEWDAGNAESSAP
jgi:hypothetical protein